MAHYGGLGDHGLPRTFRMSVAQVFMGWKGEKIGNVDDIIFDHETMEIDYLIVEGGNASQSQKFLFPANQVSDDATHRDAFVIDITEQQSEQFPDFDERALKSEDG